LQRRQRQIYSAVLISFKYRFIPGGPPKDDVQRRQRQIYSAVLISFKYWFIPGGHTNSNLRQLFFNGHEIN